MSGVHVWEVTLQFADQAGAITGTETREFGANWSAAKVSLEDVGQACAAEVAIFEKAKCRPIAVKLLPPIELPAELVA